MIMAKRILAFFLAVLLLVVSLSSCADIAEKNDDGVFRIACTSYPVASWLGEITKGVFDKLEIIFLFDEGKDMHNYQPTSRDMINIASSDLVVYTGGTSDKWVEDALESSIPKTVTSVRLMNYINDVHCDEGCLEEGNEHDHDGDEHIWLSLENAKVCVDKLSEVISMLYKSGEEKIKANSENYIKALDELREKYLLAVENAKHKTLVFADRFPFVYLVEELGLEYSAAFPGCSSDTTASFETVISLAKKIDENGLSAVVVIEGSDTKIAETVIANTRDKNAKIVELDSMQIWDGESSGYLKRMEKNLEALTVALN